MFQENNVCALYLAQDTFYGPQAMTDNNGSLPKVVSVVSSGRNSTFPFENISNKSWSQYN